MKNEQKIEETRTRNEMDEEIPYDVYIPLHFPSRAD